MKRIGFFSSLIILSLVSGCNSNNNEKDGQESVKQQRDINTVLNAHSDEIMKIAGVAGVYAGEMEDGTPYIGVMAEKKTKEMEENIPDKLEGYIVVIEETGKIEPR